MPDYEFVSLAEQNAKGMVTLTLSFYPSRKVAARGGLCRRLAQNAICEVARQRLLTAQERRGEGHVTTITW
jgi:hypothetical protein